MDESKEYLEWIHESESDLLDFETHYERKEYHRSLYFLQQACEKLAKATLLKIKLSSNSQIGLFLKKFGIPILTSKSYTHNWRKNLLVQLEDFTNNYSFIFNDVKVPFFGDIKTFFQKAKKMQDNRNPSKDEMYEIMMFCEKMFEIKETKEFTDELESKLKPLIPFFSTMSNLGSHIQESDDTIKTLMDLISSAFPLVVLMMLSTLLTPFEESRYPNNTNIDTFIPYLEDIRNILERCKLKITNE